MLLAKWNLLFHTNAPRGIVDITYRIYFIVPIYEYPSVGHNLRVYLSELNNGSRYIFFFVKDALLT
jgi:hypothetical protein